VLYVDLQGNLRSKVSVNGGTVLNLDLNDVGKNDVQTTYRGFIQSAIFGSLDLTTNAISLNNGGQYRFYASPAVWGGNSK
jgi:hypothetical protein